MMYENPLIPIYTLQDLTQEYEVNLANPSIFVIDGNHHNINKIKLDYPIRVVTFGIFIVLKGEIKVSIDFQDISLKEKDVLSILPNNILEFKYFSDNCEIKALLFESSVLSELNLQIKSQEAFDLFTNNYSKMVSLDEETFQNIIHSVDRIKLLNSSLTDNAFHSEMMHFHLSLIVYEMANFSKTISKQNQLLTSRKEDIALQFVNLVGLYFRIHKNVQFYADKMHISRKHLTRIIKEVFQIVPKQIIENKIIAEAKVLLLKNELNISQIMNDLNFEDQAMFSKFFKKHTGITPTSYRKHTS